MVSRPVRRNTWQREAVTQALGGYEGFISAQDLHSRLKEDGSSIGLATVYRALTDMVEQGQADSLHNQEGESLYRACTPGSHHHHLICRVCGLTVEIHAESVEEWARQVADENGFTDPQHVVDIFAVCADCTRRQAERNGSDSPRSAADSPV